MLQYKPTKGYIWATYSMYNKLLMRRVYAKT